MERFTLRDLLLFLLEQKNDQYRGITILMEILEANKLPPERMRFTMLAGLHALGLYEVDHPDKDYDYSEPEVKEARENLSANPGVFELFPCTLMNANFAFMWSMN